VAWTFVRRRLAIFSVAVAAVLGGLAFTTGTAHAADGGSPPFCLDADAGHVGNFGRIMQWQCSATDAFQQWTITKVAVPAGGLPLPPNTLLVQLQNVGALQYDGESMCLDANAGDIRDFGQIMQYTCNFNNSHIEGSDPYQLWIVNASSFENYGAYNLNAADGLDANAWDIGDFGQIMQYSFHNTDPFQQWKIYSQNGNVRVLENIGASS
jgi:hypothetical protein